MMDVCRELWERRNDKTFVSGTAQEFILVVDKLDDIDMIIERHNQQLRGSDVGRNRSLVE